MDAASTGDRRPAWTDLVDLWLGIIAGLVVAGPAFTLVGLPYAAPQEMQPWGPLALATGLALLVALPIVVSWASRRTDWRSAGLTALGAGLVGAVAAIPITQGAAYLGGLHVPSEPGLLAATAGIGVAMAVAPLPTCRWSLTSRLLAVLVVLLAPMAVLAAGEILTPAPVAVAHSMWVAAPLGVIPVIGLADTAVATATRGDAEDRND